MFLQKRSGLVKVNSWTDSMRERLKQLYLSDHNVRLISCIWKNARTKFLL